jgi:carboxymethylenebutenolidase
LTAGLVLFHAWWGLNADVRKRAESLRQDGYAVVTPDFFGGRVASTIDEANVLSSSFEKDEAALTEIAETAVVDLAGKVDRVGIVAWSFGAWYTWKMGIAHPDKVRAIVLFYGFGPKAVAGPMPPVLAHFAEQDPYEDIGRAREIEREMRAGGKDVRVELYAGTRHWFDERSRPEFDGAASALAWQRTNAFLGKHLRVSR